jgi:hypothetical protein
MPLFNNVLLVKIRNSHFVSSMPSFKHFLSGRWHLVSWSLINVFGSYNRGRAYFIDLATTSFLFVTDIINQIGNMTRYYLVFSLIILGCITRVWIFGSAIIICIYSTPNLALKFLEFGLLERLELNLEVVRVITGLRCFSSFWRKNSLFGISNFLGAWPFHVHIILVGF